MLEVRRIDGTPFFAHRNGRRDSLYTADEVRALETERIAQAEHRIATLEEARADLERRIDAALLGGEATSRLRGELADLAGRLAGERAALHTARQHLHVVTLALIEAEALRIEAVWAAQPDPATAWNTDCLARQLATLEEAHEPVCP